MKKILAANYQWDFDEKAFISLNIDKGIIWESKDRKNNL